MDQWENSANYSQGLKRLFLPFSSNLTVWKGSKIAQFEIAKFIIAKFEIAKFKIAKFEIAKVWNCKVRNCKSLKLQSSKLQKFKILFEILLMWPYIYKNKFEDTFEVNDPPVMQ